jgi:serine/threonine-protein phosphatase 2B catalytic subunit
MPNKNRMCSYFYGVSQSKIFLDRNKLKMIIRGHEVENAGFKYQKHTNGKPLTLTIFSAPNYCDSYRNKGSVLQITQEKLNIFTFAEVEHPLVLPNYMNIIEWSMPFLVQEVTKVFKHLLKLERTKEKRIKSDKILQN